ncbi:unnamed protein product, partial [Clonostachys rosea]
MRGWMRPATCTSLAALLLAERVNVDWADLVKLLPYAISITVAGQLSPISNCCLALRCRVKGGRRGRTVFISGLRALTGGWLLSEGGIRARGGRNYGCVGKPEDPGPAAGLADRTWSYPHRDGLYRGPSAIAVLQVFETPRDEELQYVQLGGLSDEMDMLLPLDLLR